MSTGLDCYIEERVDGWYFGIEDPSSHRFDPEYNEEGPFKTVWEMQVAFACHANPGGFSLDLRTTTSEEFSDQWDEGWRRIDDRRGF